MSSILYHLPFPRATWHAKESHSPDSVGGSPPTTALKESSWFDNKAGAMMKIRAPKVVNQQETVVPTQPGFNLIGRVIDNNCKVVNVWRTPILAWRVTTKTFEYHDGHLRVAVFTDPITLHSLYDDGVWAVEYPDGSCDLPCDSVFDNAAELLKYWQEDPDQRAASELEIGHPDLPKM
jgi:hypothetical protein